MILFASNYGPISLLPPILVIFENILSHYLLYNLRPNKCISLNYYVRNIMDFSW